MTRHALILWAARYPCPTSSVAAICDRLSVEGAREVELPEHARRPLVAFRRLRRNARERAVRRALRGVTSSAVSLSGALRVLVEASDALLHSLGEYVRQSMHANPEWRSGVAETEAAIFAARAALRGDRAGRAEKSP